MPSTPILSGGAVKLPLLGVRVRSPRVIPSGVYYPNAYTFTASAASFTLSGDTAGLKATRATSVAAGAFALTGDTAALHRQLNLGGVSASFTLTGSAAGVFEGHKLAATLASFALTGDSAGSLTTYKIVGASASFALTGSNANLATTRNVIAASGNFALTGSVASLLTAHRVSASPATFALTGTTALFPTTRYMSAVTATFALHGAAAGLGSAPMILAGNSSFVTTPFAASLYDSRRLTSAPATFTVTGDVSGLTYQRQVSAASAVFLVTGQPVFETTDTHLTASPASFVETGIAAALTSHFHFSTATGTFTVTGAPATFSQTNSVHASPGVFTMHGTAASFSSRSVFVTMPGSFHITGHDASSERRYHASLQPAHFIVTPTTTRLLATRELHVNPAQFNVTGIWLGGDREVYQPHIPIAVNQPPSGGTDYPFMAPDPSIQYLFGDAYLGYPDGGFQLPLRVRWLYGFGTAASTPPGGYLTPTHTRDIEIVDALGQRVFESTHAILQESIWGGRIRITQWLTSTAVCRVSSYLDADPTLYLTTIIPTAGQLDPRVCQILPEQLTSLRVNNVESGPVAVDLLGGYNTSLALDDLTATPLLPGLTQSTNGTRPVTRITLNVQPGIGAGTSPSCPDTPGPLLTFGGVSPDTSGNLTLDATACLRVQMPVQLYGTIQSRTAKILTPNTLTLSSDCEPCCPCAYFGRTYTGVRRLWDQGQALATQAQSVRNTLQGNKDRWDAQKACREASPLQLALIIERGCRATIGAAFCNNTDKCVAPLALRLTFQTNRGGVDVTSTVPGTILPPVYLVGSNTGRLKPTTLTGSWPVFDAFFDYADPGSITSIRLKLLIPGCQDVSLTTTVTLHVPDPTPFALLTVPSAIATLWIPVPPVYPPRFMIQQVTPYDPIDRFL